MMQNSPDIVSICQQLLDIPLFSLAKLELFLDSIKTIQPEVEPPKKTLPGGLESALRREKIFGLSTTNSAVNRKSFTGYYALVEELSGSYQPIVCLDYEKDGKSDKINWPMLRLKNHSAYSVFAPRTSDPGLPQSSSGEHDHGENEIALMNSNASGIPSVATGSFASTTSRKGLPDIPSLQKLNHKIVKPAIPAKRIRDTETQDDDFSSIKDKAGFCENCKEKYKNYHEVMIFDCSILKQKNTGNMHRIVPILPCWISFCKRWVLIELSKLKKNLTVHSWEPTSP